MSLTTLIASDTELREKIKYSFSRPKLDRKKQIIVDPHTKRYGLVGTAFDYIFRFYMERINVIGNAQKPWVAENAVERLKMDNRLYKTGIGIINKVKRLKKKFIESGELSAELVRQVIRMSYLDPVIRAPNGIQYAGYIYEDADVDDVVDIMEQFDIIEEDIFKSDDICLLNPTFGEASALVGGADADLLIDDKLIDIKTTKSLELKLKDFCQLVGYLLLHRISGIEEKRDIGISQLGIYFSRYSYLFLFEIGDIIDIDELRSLHSWFEERIKK